LSTVLGIVKSHDGFLDIQSQVGKGTTFKVYLPALDATKPPTPAPPTAELPTGQGETILVVDDEAAIREITKGTLETHGYRVLSACDGTEALSVYAQHQRDIAAVITDLAMPYMDGPATIRALHRINPGVKIVATSGLAEGKYAAPADGAGTYLRKPFTAEKLLCTVRDVLAN
jgi:CheY-like chemotaxis protein